MGMRGAETIETRSLALHAAVARRLVADPSLWEHARQRVHRWRATGSRHPHFLSAWDGLLEAPIEQVAAAIVDPGDRGQRLRRSSPFAFVLSSSERWKVWRAARADEAAPRDQRL
jgi:hypothetical protein